ELPDTRRRAQAVEAALVSRGRGGAPPPRDVSATDPRRRRPRRREEGQGGPRDVVHLPDHELTPGPPPPIQPPRYPGTLGPARHASTTASDAKPRTMSYDCADMGHAFSSRGQAPVRIHERFPEVGNRNARVARERGRRRRTANMGTSDSDEDLTGASRDIE